MRTHLGLRVLAAMVLLVLLILGVLAFLYQSSTTLNFHHYQETRRHVLLQHIAQTLGAYYQRHRNFHHVHTLLQQIAHLYPGPVILTSVHGTILGTTTPIGPGPSPYAKMAHVPITVWHKVIGYLYWSAPPLPHTPPVPPQFLSAMHSSLIMITLGAMGVAVILSYVMARNIVRPVEDLTRAAQRIIHGDLDVVCQVNRRDELGVLGQAFNELSQHLRHQQELRENMVRDVSHELRHPLTHIQGYLEAMMDERIPKSHECLEILHQETQHLNHMVDDLQRIAQAEAGTLAVTLQPTSLNKLLQQVIESFHHECQRDLMRLEVTSDPLLPPVFIDPARTKEVFDNLVRNAIQHSSPPRIIRLSAWRDHQNVYVDVQDFGEGIAVEDIPHIFTRFYRTDRSRSRSTGGVGLGLAIAKHLMAQQGGSITVASQRGAGTTFRLRFPLSESITTSSH